MLKSFLKGLALAGVGLSLVANTAHAQKPGPELGIQFLTLDMNNPDGDDNNATVFGFGSGNVSVAFYLTEMIALEPIITFDYMSPETGDAASSLGLNLGVPIYLKKGFGQAGGFFVEPFFGINSNDGGAGDAVSQMHFGLALGTKLKISDDFFWRIQAFYQNTMENEDDFLPQETDIGLSGGVSLYWPK
jgi:hypothetical protein